MQPCYWRLYYADDTHRDEPQEGASILMARPGALVLAVMQGVSSGLPLHDEVSATLARRPLCKVELFDVAREQMFRPVFYRNMSTDVRFDGGMGNDRRQDALVFGRVNARTLEYELYATYDGQTIIGCPDSELRSGAIYNCAQGVY